MAIAVAACQPGPDEFERAEQRFYFLQENRASRAELCQQGRKVTAAAADARRSADYRKWHSMIYLLCDV